METLQTDFCYLTSPFLANSWSDLKKNDSESVISKKKKVMKRKEKKKGGWKEPVEIQFPINSPSSRSTSRVSYVATGIVYRTLSFVSLTLFKANPRPDYKCEAAVEAMVRGGYVSYTRNKWSSIYDSIFKRFDGLFWLSPSLTIPGFHLSV